MKYLFPIPSAGTLSPWRAVAVGYLFLYVCCTFKARAIVYFKERTPCKLCRQPVFVVAGCLNPGLCASNAVNDLSHSRGRKGVLRLRRLGKEPQLLWEKRHNMSPLFCGHLFAVLPKPRRLKVRKTQFTSRAPNWRESCKSPPCFSRRRLSALGNGRWCVALMFIFFKPPLRFTFLGDKFSFNETIEESHKSTQAWLG